MDEIAFSPDARRIAVAGAANFDSDLRDESGHSMVSEGPIWATDLGTARTRRISPPHRSPATGQVQEDAYRYFGLVWTPDSRFVVATRQYKDKDAPSVLKDAAAAFDVAAGKPTPVTTPLRLLWERARSHTAFSPDGRGTATIDHVAPLPVDAIVRIQQDRMTAFSQTFLSDYGLKGVYWTPDGRYIVAATLVENGFHRNCILHLVSTAGGRSVRSLPLHESFGHIGFSRNGRWLIALDGSDVVLWNWRTGEKRVLPGPKCQVAAMDWVELPSRR